MEEKLTRQITYAILAPTVGKQHPHYAGENLGMVTFMRFSGAFFDDF